MDPDNEADQELDTPLQAEFREALSLGQPQIADLKLPDRLRNLFSTLIARDVHELLRERGGPPLVVGRVAMADVLSCETYYLQESNIPFEYNTPKARGQLASQVIKRWYFRDMRAIQARAWHPIDDIHEFLDEIASDGGNLADFVGSLGSSERSELASEIAGVVEDFGEAWPSSLRPTHARAGYAMRATLAEGSVAISSRVSFKFGTPKSRSAGMVQRNVILVDIKAGEQRETLERPNRFTYAMLETLKSRVLPARTITWYAADQTFSVDDITEDHAEAATRRAADAVSRIVRLSQGAAPNKNPGWRCNYCPVRDSCRVGMQYLETQ